MKIAVLADPHGNLPALRCVIGAAREAGIERFLIAGDLVGYGPRPNEVVELIRGLNATAIRGNHDDAVIEQDFLWLNDFAAAAAKWTTEVISGGNLAFLRSLGQSENLTLDGRIIGLFHGSPEDPLEYVFDESRAEQLLNATDQDIMICGHTHVPLEARLGDRLFLNPGGVGQPRDGDPKASLIELDLRTLETHLVRIPYDIESVQRDMLSLGLPRFLADRLSRGL